jgi:hypothetical protein
MTGPERTIVARHRTRTAHTGEVPVASHLKPEKQPINITAPVA